MDSYTVATNRGGEAFRFIYDDADVADIFEYNSLDWGTYDSSNITFAGVIAPLLDDAGEALAGWYRVSVPFFHLDAVSSVYVDIEGAGYTAEYTTNGTTWNTLTPTIAVTQTADFDIRVNFAAGVDDAHVDSIKVIALKTDRIFSNRSARTLTFSGDEIVNGVLVSTGGQDLTISAAPGDSDADALNVGTIEMWVKLTGSTTPLVSPAAGVEYRDGVTLVSHPQDTWYHYVRVYTTASNSPIVINDDLELRHVAVYPQRMTAPQVAALYAAQTPVVLTVIDSSTITVTESAPSVDIYAYTWTSSGF